MGLSAVGIRRRPPINRTSFSHVVKLPCALVPYHPHGTIMASAMACAMTFSRVFVGPPPQRDGRLLWRTAIGMGVAGDRAMAMP